MTKLFDIAYSNEVCGILQIAVEAGADQDEAERKLASDLGIDVEDLDLVWVCDVKEVDDHRDYSPADVVYRSYRGDGSFVKADAEPIS